MFAVTGNFTSSLQYQMLTNFTLINGDYNAFSTILKSYSYEFDVIFLLDERLTKTQIQGLSTFIIVACVVIMIHIFATLSL